MDAELVFGTADTYCLTSLYQKHREATRVFAPFLGAGQHQQDIGIAVGDEPLDTVQAPYPGCLVVIGTGLDGSQIGTSVRLGEHHCCRHFTSGKTRQEAGFHLLAAELSDSFGDLLQPEDGHQSGLGAGDDFDHHPVNCPREIQPAVLPRQNCTH